MTTQDLHIHTVYSAHDMAVAPEQTLSLIKYIAHADIIGISDHFEDLLDNWDLYEKAVRAQGFAVGTEVDGSSYVEKAVKVNSDYYIYHCRNKETEYTALETLLITGKPVIIAHPNFMETDLSRVPSNCFVEVSNRYAWRSNWKEDLGPYVQKFNWVISSDAHQPNWLNQNVARKIATELGIKETILFKQ